MSFINTFPIPYIFETHAFDCNLHIFRSSQKIIILQIPIIIINKKSVINAYTNVVCCCDTLVKKTYIMILLRVFAIFILYVQ